MKNWLKKVFAGNKEGEKKVETEIEQDRNAVLTLSMSSKLYYNGLDLEFIDLICFIDDKKKSKYIEDVLNLFVRFDVTNQLTSIEYTYKLIEIENNGIDIDFLRYLAKYEERRTVTRQGVTEVTVRQSENELGINKIDNYYAALNFISTNAKRKYERGFTNFEFEENLYQTVVAPNNEKNSAFLISITDFAILLSKSNIKDKSEFYFEQIFKHKDESNVSNVGVAIYFRKIGEYFEEIEDYENSLKWLEAGLLLNPKLGIKNKMIEIKKKVN